MNNRSFPEGARIGAWRVWPRGNCMERDGERRSLEPKVMDLLVVLAERPGEVVSHEEIFAALWPNMIVGEDTLARSISKLRRAFDDDAKAPAYVETVSKRGYRLIADVRPAVAGVTGFAASKRRVLWAGAAAAAVLVLGSVLAMQFGAEREADARIARAMDHYYQYTRADNETAIALYEQVLATEPENAQALAGLATALVQRVLRWPNPPGGEDFARTSLGEALADGRTSTLQAQAWLTRARDLSARAAAQAPRAAFVYQAQGLTLAASQDFDGAERAYQQAIAIDNDAWGALINLGDLHDIRGESASALAFYEQAYDAMERAYGREPQRVRHWQAEVGALIARRYSANGDGAVAEAWYRRVLTRSPLHEPSVVGLASVLQQKGDAEGAARLCSDLMARNASPACERLIQP